ncbi:uncharacterized protein LOC115677447 [Syzygium oleosum]|uniref:uncharacterized protein LOC115677447 n=1 Tax=Syzygium oleosum TaxID=219896 RepID=UPI0011D2BD0F|nr:uncharacterized protein LOC115677447 [Syzygium oleosum]KAI6682379.1 hypothetical protein NL676_036260 [Syzygium grande]
MAAGAAECLLRCVYEGCIPGCDSGVERRPYHRNCGCALHKKSRSNCPRPAGKGKGVSVSYPIRRAWSEGSLVLMASAGSSPSSSPVVGRSQVVGSCDGDREMDDGFCLKM